MPATSSSAAAYRLGVGCGCFTSVKPVGSIEGVAIWTLHGSCKGIERITLLQNHAQCRRAWAGTWAKALTNRGDLMMGG